jgi:hypothetical protein
MKTQGGEDGGGILGFHPYFDIQHIWDGRVVSSTRWLYFNPKEVPWCLFLVEAEWTPGLLNVARRSRSLKIFQASLQESNLAYAVVLCSASTICATTCPTEIYSTNEFSVETNLSVECKGELGKYSWLEGLDYSS